MDQHWFKEGAEISSLLGDWFYNWPNLLTGNKEEILDAVENGNADAIQLCIRAANSILSQKNSRFRAVALRYSEVKICCFEWQFEQVI